MTEMSPVKTSYYRSRRHDIVSKFILVMTLVAMELIQTMAGSLDMPFILSVIFGVTSFVTVSAIIFTLKDIP